MIINIKSIAMSKKATTSVSQLLYCMLQQHQSTKIFTFWSPLIICIQQFLLFLNLYFGVCDFFSYFPVRKHFKTCENNNLFVFSSAGHHSKPPESAVEKKTNNKNLINGLTSVQRKRRRRMKRKSELRSHQGLCKHLVSVSLWLK